MHRTTRKPIPAALYSIIAFTLTILCTLSASAQTFRGGINGTVTDRTGATIANATVTAIQDGTSLTRTTLSSSAGEFLFQDLPLGTYSVTVSFNGFQTPIKTPTTTLIAAVLLHVVPFMLPPSI